MDGSVALWFPIQTFYDRRARFKLNDVGKKECFKNVEYTFTLCPHWFLLAFRKLIYFV